METRGYDRSTGIYHSHRGSLPIPPLSLPSLLLRSNLRPDRPAYIDARSGQALTHAELRDSVRRVAAGLACYAGLRPGDVLFILSPNSFAIPLLSLATMLAGGVVTLANPLYTPAEIDKQFRDSRAKFLCTISSLLHNLITLTPPFLILLDDSTTESSFPPPPPSLSLSRLLQADPAHMPGISARPEDPAALLYSSGTTGMSKGVIITHRNLVAVVSLLNHMEGQLPPHHSYLCVLPMFHCYGFEMFSCYLPAVGCTVVVMPRFDMRGMLEAIQRFKITHLPVVPPILFALTKSEIVSKYDLSSLQEMLCAGAPLSKEVIIAAGIRFPGLRIKQVYGLTEAAALVTISVTEQEMQNRDSVGRLIPNAEARIVDTHSGEPLAPHSKGELWLRGPTVMQGYFGNPGATAAALDSQGWLQTGDLCYFDEEGYLYIVDRLKELIKYKGLQVAPAELEAVLLCHPDIADAAVIPLEDEEAGQIPMACVVRKVSSTAKESDVMEFVMSKVAPYKRVRRVLFVDAIPKSQAGKILRRQLVTTVSSRL